MLPPSRKKKNTEAKEIKDKFNKFANNVGFIQKEPDSENQELTQLELMQNIENSKYFNEEKIDAYLVDKEIDFNSLSTDYVLSLIHI